MITPSVLLDGCDPATSCVDDVADIVLDSEYVVDPMYDVVDSEGVDVCGRDVVGLLYAVMGAEVDTGYFVPTSIVDAAAYPKILKCTVILQYSHLKGNLITTKI